MIRRVLTLIGGLCVLILVLAVGVLTWLFAGDGVRQALERQLSGWLEQPVHIGEAAVRFVPRPALRLERVTIGEPVRVTLGRVDVSTGLRALLSRRLEDAEVAVSDSRVEMPLPFSLPSTGRTAATTAADDAAAIQLVSVRRIRLRDVTIVSLGRELHLTADSSLNASRLEITSFTASTGQLALDASGSVELAPRVVASLSATSSLLDVDSLLTLATAFVGDAADDATVARSGARLSVRVTAPRARTAGMDLTDLDALVTAYDGAVTIDPFVFGILGGRHEGWLSAALGSTPNIRVGSSVVDIDVAQLAEFGGATGAISGRMSGTARVGAQGRDIAAVLASARGVGDVAIQDGSMQGLDLVRTVVGFLGNTADAGRPAAGSAFDRIAATFAVANGRVSSEDLTLESEDVDLMGRGALEIETKALDGRVNLLVSEALSKEADRRLYRYTMLGNRVVLPATVRGTLREPRIGIDAGAAIKRGIANEVERRLQDFFDRVGPF